MTCKCTPATSLFDLCTPCSNRAWQAGADLVSKDRDNVHYMGNPFGTERYERRYDEKGNILETVRIV